MDAVIDAQTVSHANDSHTNETDAPIRRKYNLAGCFMLVGILVAKSDRANKDQPVSLAQCWLPLSAYRLPKNQYTTYRHPGIVPALAERTFRRVSPSIDAYAAERGWDVQPVMYFYRPPALNALIGEEGKIKDMPLLMRTIPTVKRFMIDATSQTETQSVIRDLVDICAKVLEEAAIAEPPYLQEEFHPRVALNQLLSDFPFLVHHIFKALPNLYILRHRARVNGREDTIHHVRYEREAIQDLDTNRMLRPNLINPAP